MSIDKKITFISHKTYNNKDESFMPKAGKTQVPKWFSSSDKYFKDPVKEDVVQHEWGAKVLNFKSCPALLDLFLDSYYLTTPCDIIFYKDPTSGLQMAKTEKGYEDFIGYRDPMEGFVHPHGYEAHHFHWYPNWGVKLEKGYSAIFMSPMNRYDLPFISTAGIIDSDVLDIPGLVPFFLRSNFSGIIPAGTPYVQVFPFKRESWKMETVYPDQEEIIERHNKSGNFLRTTDGGQYKKHLWNRKSYE